MFDMVAIGRHIFALRRNRNMTQMELSDRLGISHQAVSKWERGESMPDISALPLLADILETSVDHLLADTGQGNKETNVVQSVLGGTVLDEINDGTITLQHIGDVASILKPMQVDEMAAGVPEVDIGSLSGIAPFLSREVLDGLAKRVAEVGGIGELCGIAPFLSRDVLDGLAKRAAEVSGIGELCGIAPFLSREVLDELAKRAAEVGGIGELCGIAPFLSREVLDGLAKRAAEVSGIGELCGIAPFLSREVLNGLAEKCAVRQTML